jgi:polysaccharide deacetylase family protein (PEP-CTERM system associated)
MNILSFDIEEWFHILDHEETSDPNGWRKFSSRVEPVIEALLDLLARHQVRATFFFLGWVAERAPNLVRAVSAAGHDIGSHSYGHQLVYNQSRKDFEEDLRKSLDILGNITGQSINKYRAPGFSIVPGCEWVFPVLLENGIEVDASMFPATRAHGGYNRNIPSHPFRLVTEQGALIEMPMNTARIMGREIVFSGGGYFRVMPLWAIRHLMSNSAYVMTYLHPRDFDGDQPIVPGLSAVRRFKSYVGIRRSFAKLAKLLVEYQWNSLAQVLKNGAEGLGSLEEISLHPHSN